MFLRVEDIGQIFAGSSNLDKSAGYVALKGLSGSDDLRLLLYVSSLSNNSKLSPMISACNPHCRAGVHGVLFHSKSAL